MPDRASGQIMIRADKAAVMAVIADLPAYPDWARGVRRIEVLEVGPDGRPLRARFEVDAGVLRDEYVLEYDWSDDERVSWHLVQGRVQRGQEGTYTLIGGDGEVEVTYQLVVDMPIPVPNIIRRRAERSVIDTALRELKRRVEARDRR